MPKVGVNTRIIGAAIKAATRFPGLRVRQAGATGNAQPLPEGGLATYANGIVTFDPLAPRNALDGTALDVAAISELGDPYFNFTGVPSELAVDLGTIALPAGRALAFIPKET